MSNNVIPINYDTEQPTISARDLHEALEIKTRYNDWFLRVREYGFSENIDFKAVTQKRVTAQGNETTYIDHQISIDMAKQICMLQRTNKGKLYRQYFLDLEKAWNTPEQIFARALKIADRRIKSLEANNAMLAEDVERMKPKEVFADAVSASDTSILIGDLAKMLNQNGFRTGQKRLFEWMRENGYLMKRGSSRNLPTQRSMELGLFQIQERVRIGSDGVSIIDRTTKVTGKGQQYFVNKFSERKE